MGEQVNEATSAVARAKQRIDSILGRAKAGERVDPTELATARAAHELAELQVEGASAQEAADNELSEKHATGRGKLRAKVGKTELPDVPGAVADAVAALRALEAAVTSRNDAVGSWARTATAKGVTADSEIDGMVLDARGALVVDGVAYRSLALPGVLNRVLGIKNNQLYVKEHAENEAEALTRELARPPQLKIVTVPYTERERLWAWANDLGPQHRQTPNRLQAYYDKFGDQTPEEQDSRLAELLKDTDWRQAIRANGHRERRAAGMPYLATKPDEAYPDWIDNEQLVELYELLPDSYIQKFNEDPVTSGHT